MKRLSEPFDYDYNLIPPEPNFFTAGFMMDREDRFDRMKTRPRSLVTAECLILLLVRYIIKDREEFFSGAQRSLIVWQILLRTKYDDNNSDKVGIKRLLSNGVYKAAYPLHDGKYIGDEKGQLSDRMVSDTGSTRVLRQAACLSSQQLAWLFFLVDLVQGVGSVVQVV